MVVRSMYWTILLNIDGVLVREVKIQPSLYVNPLITLLQVLLSVWVVITCGYDHLMNGFWKEQSVKKRRSNAQAIRLFRWLDGLFTLLIAEQWQRALLQYRDHEPVLIRQLQWYTTWDDSVIKAIVSPETLDKLRMVTETKADFKQQKETSFDDGVHLPLLHELWTNLIGDNEKYSSVPSLVDPRWERLGFQGPDPRSDLRGMGVASLGLMAAFSRTEQARAIYFRSIRPSHWYQKVGLQLYLLCRYPWACAGINITSFINDLLEEQLLDHYMAVSSESPLPSPGSLDRIFGAIWMRLDSAWEQATPDSIMQFPRVWKEVQQSFRRVLQ